jgi:hypothetical protein
MPIKNVFENPRDFLIPISGPDKRDDGNTYIDMLYLKYRDIVAVGLAKTLCHWQLENHPYVRVRSGSQDRLEYLYAEGVRWVLLIPYKITLPDTCEDV